MEGKMNPRRLSLLILLAASLVLSACGDSGAIEPTLAPSIKVPEPTVAPPTEAAQPAEPQPIETSDPEGAVQPSREVEVIIVDSAYENKMTTIPVGTTVTWIHDGQYPHTVTFDDGSVDSGNLGGGSTFSYTFDQPGSYPYYCTYHGGPVGSGMSGTIIVTDQ